MYFLGFERSPEFEELWHRLQVLEAWRELAIRPASVEECHPHDRFLLPTNHRQKKWEKTTDRKQQQEEEEEGSAPFTMDDVNALQDQSLKVRQFMNDAMTTMAIETTEWDDHLVARTSQISKAGLGLFYIPLATTNPSSPQQPSPSSLPAPQQPQNEKAEEEPSGGGVVVPPDTVLCYCTGHIHSFSSSRRLLESPLDRSYLLWIQGDTLVDPRSLPHVKARYVNDPLNDDCINCRFVPQKVDGKDVRAAVVTTRPIRPGEELFISYGEFYWDQQPTKGTRLIPPPQGLHNVMAMEAT